MEGFNWGIFVLLFVYMAGKTIAIFYYREKAKTAYNRGVTTGIDIRRSVDEPDFAVQAAAIRRREDHIIELYTWLHEALILADSWIDGDDRDRLVDLVSRIDAGEWALRPPFDHFDKAPDDALV